MNAQTADIAIKAALRAEAMARRDTLTTTVREHGSTEIAVRANRIVALAKPETIAAYMPIWSEVDPRPIIAAAFAHGIRVALPAVVDATTLVFRGYEEGDSLVGGRFGTVHPAPSAEILVPDLVISPMIAFDRAGMRLGHGRGFYDRAIARLHGEGKRPLLVGIAFAVQEVAAIPHEGHDIRMDVIVTEKETLDYRR